MKKFMVLLLAILVLISCIFVSCKNKEKDDDGGTTVSGLEENADEYGFEVTDVTDENGKKVTDKDGKTVTTEVAVVYKKDKKGKTYAEVLNPNGEAVTDKNGKAVTMKVTQTTTEKETTTKKSNKKTTTAGLTTTTAPKPTGTTKKDVETTNEDETTKLEKGAVPKTDASGKEVSFSQKDQMILKSMLEVPYLYTASYENSDGVPLSIATHTAVWMAERDGGTKTIYPSSPVVLNLFKYYGQTVVNFKTQCNKYSEESGAPIKYISKDDTFEITGFTAKKQEVSISRIEALGNGYYKITGKVSNAAGKNKVAAIVQKNKLDTSLGFSIKALKWS